MKGNKVLSFLFGLLLLGWGCTKDPAVQPSPDPEPPEEGSQTEWVIPVVFHVLYEHADDPWESPDYEVFTQRIEQLNRFFQGTLFDPSQMKDGPTEKVNVRFVLAERDPEGNLLEEPGVHRYPYPGSANMSYNRFMNVGRTLTADDEAVLWDPNRYVNIWLFSFLQAIGSEEDETFTTGSTYLPYCSSAHPLDKLTVWDWAFNEQPYYMHGMSLNNNYFQPTGPSGSIMDDEGMFTLCHEMGHYLGLRHVFASAEECVDTDNASDDGCSDTPKYNRDAYEEMLANMPVGYVEAELYYRQPCDGSERFLSTNLMDYYYGYQTNLTLQQRYRMEHVLRYSPWIPRSEEEKAALANRIPASRAVVERPLPVREDD